RGVVEARGGELRYVGVRGQPRYLRRDVGPVRAIVARDAHHAVVGACVIQPGLLRRFGEAHQITVGTDPVVFGDGYILAFDAQRFERVEVSGGGQIRADRLPRVSAVRRFQDAVGADEYRRGVVRRDQHRRVPVPPVRLLAFGRFGGDRFAFIGHAVDAVHPAVLRFGVHDAAVGRI